MRAGTYLAGVSRRQGQRNRDPPEVGDTEQLCIGGDGLTQRYATRDDLTGPVMSIIGDAVAGANLTRSEALAFARNAAPAGAAA